MSYRGSNVQNRLSKSSDKSLSWIDEIFKRFITDTWEVGPSNLYSLTTITSVKINSIDKSEDFVRKLIERITKYSSKADLALVSRHLDEIKHGYRFLGFPLIDLKAKLTYRGLVGASSSFGQPAFEVGLFFDPILNVPCIPGSSIKGAVKATNILNFDDNSVGRLDFSDAYPVERGVNGYIIIPDVLTPHYSKGGEDVLKEDEAMPTPIPFLSLAPTTTFRFLIADRARKADQPFLETLLKAVAVAFSLGVGAKTALGYGTFELIEASVEEGG